jgi:hypothetical protein
VAALAVPSRLGTGIPMPSGAWRHDYIGIVVWGEYGRDPWLP